jgi:hypothetical protein
MRSVVLSVEIRHHCAERAEGVRGSSVIMRAKTLPEAIQKWNRCAIGPNTLGSIPC